MSFVQQKITTDNAPFNAELFFSTQRTLGAAPYVIGDFIGFKIVASAGFLHNLAEIGDPGGEARAAYARIRWDNREQGQIVVMLGMGQDPAKGGSV